MRRARTADDLNRPSAASPMPPATCRQARDRRDRRARPSSAVAAGRPRAEFVGVADRRITGGPEHAAAQQLRRTMDPRHTAAAIGMSDNERAHALTITDQQLHQRLELCPRYPLDEPTSGESAPTPTGIACDTPNSTAFQPSSAIMRPITTREVTDRRSGRNHSELDRMGKAFYGFRRPDPLAGQLGGCSDRTRMWIGRRPLTGIDVSPSSRLGAVRRVMSCGRGGLRRITGCCR